VTVSNEHTRLANPTTPIFILSQSRFHSFIIRFSAMYFPSRSCPTSRIAYLSFQNVPPQLSRYNAHHSPNPYTIEFIPGRIDCPSDFPRPSIYIESTYASRSAYLLSKISPPPNPYFIPRSPAQIRKPSLSTPNGWNQGTSTSRTTFLTSILLGTEIFFSISLAYRIPRYPGASARC
jgi:hypothetical protein